MYHESTRCISILFYTNKHDKIKKNCVILENISLLKKLFPETIMDKIFETNSSFHVK